jgi:uncharacterized protein (DUF1778 family)
MSGASFPVNLRVRADVRDLIDQAARTHRKSRSEFMIDAARRAAEEALLDQTFVRVDAETHARFLEILDKPAGGEGYARLMAVREPWSR